MAIRGPFALYVDMIIDCTIFYYVAVALGGFTIIIEHITSFPSTVSINPGKSYKVQDSDLIFTNASQFTYLHDQFLNITLPLNLEDCCS